MSDNQRTTTAIERILESINSMVVTCAFLGVVWLAVHVVANPGGARDVHRFIQSHMSNLVDPEVSVTISKGSGEDFFYMYTVSNGFFAVQPIRHFAVATRSRIVPFPGQDWIQFLEIGVAAQHHMVWFPNPQRRDFAVVRRGQSRDGFVLKSRLPPAIVRAIAAHDVQYSDWNGPMPEIITPAGERIWSWTLGPMEAVWPNRVEVRDVFDRLMGDVRRSDELGWITDPASTAEILFLIELARTRLEDGDGANAVTTLRKSVTVAEAAGVGVVSRDVVSLLRGNVEWLTKNIET